VLALLLLGASPPLLLEPAAALEELRPRAKEEPLAWAEAQLLLGNPRRALEALDRDPSDPRALRLELDARVRLGDRAGAERAALALSKHEGWRMHALNTLGAVQLARDRDTSARVGLVLYACALAVLLLGGARELIRIRRESALMIAAVLAGIALAYRAEPPLSVAFALFDLAALAAVHAGVATFHRLAPGARGRLILATLVILAIAGALGAIAARAVT